MWGYGLERAGSGQGQVSVICECGNETSGSITCMEFLDQLRTGQLLKKDCAPWSKLAVKLMQLAYASFLMSTVFCMYHYIVATSSFWFPQVCHRLTHFKKSTVITLPRTTHTKEKHSHSSSQNTSYKRRAQSQLFPEHLLQKKSTVIALPRTPPTKETPGQHHVIYSF